MNWTAKIPPEQMAVVLCDDLTKKFRILKGLPKDKVAIILDGVVDGLMGNSLHYPIHGSLVPDFLKSMDPLYCDGFQVGETWAKIAREWPEKPADAPAL